MRLTESVLKNPAAAVVGVVLLTFVGLVSLFKLPIQLLPDIEQPTISVIAHWRAAAPQEVEAEIIEPIEEVLEGINGVKEMNANAGAGNANVTLTFEMGSDMQEALIDIISRLNRLPPLPSNVRPPVVRLGGWGGNAPVLSWFFLQQLDGKAMDMDANLLILESLVKPVIESVPGVSGMEVGGGGRFQQQLIIEFDPYRAAQLGIELPVAVRQVGGSNDVSGGFVDVGRRRYTLRFEGRYAADELGELVLDWRNGSPVKLADIADISVQMPENMGISRQNGNQALGFRVNRESGANVLQALNGVKREIEILNDGVLAKKGVKLVQSFDSSVFIYRAINLVTSNLVVGLLLAVGGLWLFLRRLRATLIVATAIPVSLLATFLVMQLTGRTLNVISMAGLAFAVGMVLDAAIVVLENIIRQREQGMSNDQASLVGTQRVWGALLASTLTTVVIFVPVLFLKDIEGQLFGDLALAIAVSVTFSLVVAISVVPLASRYWLQQESSKDHHEALWRSISTRIIRLTDNARHRLLIAVSMILVPLLLTWVLLPELDYLPPVKRDAVDTFFQFPPATNNDTIRRDVVDEIGRRMQPYMDGEKSPALKNYYMIIWPGGGTMGTRAKDQSQVEELQRVINQEITANIPDLRAFSQQGDLFGNFGGGRGIPVHLQSRDSQRLSEVAQQAVDILSAALPGAQVRPRSELEDSEPEIQLTPRDTRIHEMGWTRRDIGTVTRALGDGIFVGEYFDGNEQLDIIFRAKTWQSPDEFSRMPLAMPNGAVVPLSELVEIQRAVGPNAITRVDGKRTKTLEVVPPETMSLEQAVAALKELAEPQIMALMPEDGSILYGGSADNLRRAIATISENFLIALVVLTLLMSALFRSIKDSVLVILAIPLATVGSVIMLRLLNLFAFQPLDLLTMIGFVILLGLVVNNAILLVHQTRQAELDGLDRRAAVLQALQLRLRPIFMSTLTSLFGMLPLLLMPGVGSVIYRGMAAVIVGGMAVSTVFTLVLLPCLLRIGERRAPTRQACTES